MEKNKQAINIYDDEMLNIYNSFISKGEGEEK